MGNTCRKGGERGGRGEEEWEEGGKGGRGEEE